MSKRFKAGTGRWTVTAGNPFHVPYSGKHAKRKLKWTVTKMPKSKVASSLAMVNRRTGGYVDLEKKFKDLDFTSTVFSTSWITMEDSTAKCLSATAIGDGPENRDGRVYHVTAIEIIGQIGQPALEAQSSLSSNKTCRLKLVLDKQTNAAQMTGAQLMDEGGSNNIDSFRLLENTRRFTVLKSKQILLKPHNVAQGEVDKFASATLITPFKIYHSFKKPLRVQCIGGQSTAVIESIADNSLHLVGCSTSAAATLNYQVRIRFQG